MPGESSDVFEQKAASNVPEIGWNSESLPPDRQELCKPGEVSHYVKQI